MCPQKHFKSIFPSSQPAAEKFLSPQRAFSNILSCWLYVAYMRERKYIRLGRKERERERERERGECAGGMEKLGV